MFQLRHIPIPRPSLKQIVLGSLGTSIVLAGIMGNLATEGLQILAVTLTDAPLKPMDKWENRPIFQADSCVNHASSVA